MAATIRDVARLAGVSQSSVSRALAAPDQVRAATRERVERAVAQLGYEPSRIARGLSTGRTGTLGFLVPDIANPLFAGIVKAAQRRSRDLGLAVLLADADEDPATELDLIRTLTKQVDGFVLCAPRAADEELRSVCGDLPVVLLNRRVGRLPAVIFDNADGVRQALAHLAALGHRRVAYVAGPRTSWVNRERQRAVRTGAAALGVDVVEPGNVSPDLEGGVAVADLVLAAGVTAVIAYNDMIALGLVSRFAVRGVTVPGDISIVGFDDIPAAALVSPALSTVSQPQDRCGRAGVDLLADLLDDRPTGRARAGGPRASLPTRLIVRASTGPARHP
ncbi:LacI family DNA-binding transcriptional regulator [Dactylosporangium aurantiacum]|uniref:LacI family DNA-binding transcriptional regulator n=1 Tax=Dactylosporangium aurantiacum TaxID=35754 RepID=A0A9Q9IFM8_9ACTN|nr:LacI family DNA-binding transcriptional regulator [Dactylosporangium aurantiacum]MDG6101884.1 LacI family DNA-binding transcriptional regulator [Dactylosporangium aurantiacum]UWZ52318.1 LacI family DNA-binding transcriptional regulator [Dactylosporangium aurantiacum]